MSVSNYGWNTYKDVCNKNFVVEARSFFEQPFLKSFYHKPGQKQKGRPRKHKKPDDMTASHEAQELESNYYIIE